MTTFTVKNIPDDLYEKLKIAAKLNRRSINSEIIICIEKTVQSQVVDPALMIKRARKLRTYTQTYPITEDELTQAKTIGRP
ncbi:MAG: Arc family DNA-binding protein [Chloroflexota bacterium]|nr:Arc family DNA-binding protein [Chloroflexota bacterium]